MNCLGYGSVSVCDWKQRNKVSAELQYIQLSELLDGVRQVKEGNTS